MTRDDGWDWHDDEDIRDTARQAREAIARLALRHPDFTSQDYKKFNPLMQRLRELASENQ